MNNKRGIIFSIIAISLVLLMVVGATFAYFQAQINDGTSSEVAIDTDTVDILTFNASNDIMLEATQESFSREEGNISGTTTLNAHLIANSTTQRATYKYNVYLDITKNNFVYSTSNKTPEIVLVIKNPKGQYVTTYNSKLGSTTKVDLNGEQVTGYDITTKIGLIEISIDYIIDATPSTKGEADQNWKISVVFVNLDSNQSANAGKSFKAKAKVQSEKINVLDLGDNNDYYKSSTYINKIKNVYFVNYIAEEELNSVASDVKWDLSSSKDKSIMGWLKNENDDETAPYNLYIGSNLKEGEKIVVRSFADAFYNMQNLETVDLNLDILDTSNLNDTSYMFYHNSKLTTITGIKDLDVSNVTNMSSMFSNARALTELDLSKWDTQNVTNMSYMFYYDINLIELDLSDWNTQNVTNMSYMFSGASSLTSIIGIEDLDVSNVVDMSGMFSTITQYQYMKITKLNLSNWDTHNVTNMSNMFGSSSNALNYSGYNNNIVKINISGWDTSNVRNMSKMFLKCNKLTEIIGIENLDISNVTDMSAMFADVNSSIIPDISNWNTSKVENLSNIFYNTYYNYDVSKIDTSNVTDMSAMFRNYSGSIINGIENLNVSKVTDMSQMFYATSTLTELDLSRWDTSNVKNMSSMYGYANSLTLLNLSNWDTSNVTDMSGMFRSTTKLTSIDMRKATFNQETNYTDMFKSTNSALKVIITGEDNKQRLLDNTDLTEDQLDVLPE